MSHGEVGEAAYIRLKQTHWAPSWKTPSNPAVHSKAPRSLQQPMATRDGGTVRMLAKPAVAEVVPSSTK